MQPICHQCGLMHPPLSPGETCPLVKKEDSKYNFSEFFSELKSLLIDFIKENNLDELQQKNLFDNINMHVNDFLEKRKKK